ncbi:polymorphic toxin type 44 domain-containing protein [Halomonas salifodinae]|uniref:Polymorphic toxin type 44 domain-containing protein n=1 Tax=Halomonas salifodinae TaxID=438745 RepID=A0ABW2F3G2_9GAMM
MSEWRLVATTHTTPASIDDPFEVILPCRHEGQVPEIAAWMIDEIQQNAVSDVALAMKRQNTYSAERELREWQREGEELGFLQQIRRSVVKPDFYGIERANKLGAWGGWTLMVRENGDWDHKREIRTKYPTLGKTSYRYHHKYNNYEYYYDIWSNIHYGYLGLFCGFPRNALLDGAGLEQIGSDVRHRRWPTDRSADNGEGLRRFDDVTDSLSIRIGFDLFDAFPDPQRLTARSLLNRIEAAPYPMETGSKMLHDCQLARQRDE